MIEMLKSYQLSRVSQNLWSLELYLEVDRRLNELKNKFGHGNIGLFKVSKQALMSCLLIFTTDLASLEACARSWHIPCQSQ